MTFLRHSCPIIVTLAIWMAAFSTAPKKPAISDHQILKSITDHSKDLANN